MTDPVAEFMARAPFAEVLTATEGPIRAWGADAAAVVAKAAAPVLHAEATGFVPIPPPVRLHEPRRPATGRYRNTDDCALVRRLCEDMDFPTLADECGVSPCTAGRWHRGARLPRPADRARLHRVAHEWLTKAERAPFDVLETCP